MRPSVLRVFSLLLLAGAGCATGFPANPPPPHLADGGVAVAPPPDEDAAVEPDSGPDPQPNPDPAPGDPNPGNDVTAKCAINTVKDVVGLADCAFKLTGCTTCVKEALTKRPGCEGAMIDYGAVAKTVCQF
jgi:hypothetical protein